ncbi:elongation factor Ts [Corynebacterium phocae]|uniref:Elongation factor Ts n=1 Tax=Corynebacterium phocae TaxID=161895 RepID=A0A1L7D2H2_9CORY|nr:translation elongation factor Ts [Corynebacterium phocae]APT92318.1 elongation factor Ts [Corynebacterium phocae]KAA8724907.1 elongation factor Ts [Corynebacterium phocae]
MANYTAADVKALRGATAAGMLDCKKALEESGGDYDKAVEILRIKGAKSVSKRADREASEGLIAVSGNTMVEVNCETDFVAKNQAFIDFAHKITEAAAAAKANSTEELNAAEIDGQTVEEVVTAESAKTGEKLQIGRVVTLEGDNVAHYLHQRSADLPPAIGVLVSYEGDKEVAHAVALQIAAMKAEYLTREDVPAEVVQKERDIAEATTREEGKPEAALPKIVEGRLNGFFKSVVLPEQPSMTDSKKNVQKVLDEADTKILAFKRFELGA